MSNPNKSIIKEYDNEAISKLLVGHRIVDVEGESFVLDNDIRVEVVPNEGCGGCSSGNYWVNKLETCEAVITSVRTESIDDVEDKYGSSIIYRIFVLAAGKESLLLEVKGDDGNGYYGTGYELYVRSV